MVKLNGHKPGIGEDEQPDGYARSNRVFMHAAMICHGGQSEGWKVQNGLVFIEWKVEGIKKLEGISSQCCCDLNLEFTGFS
jgi:hypothetical protein